MSVPLPAEPTLTGASLRAAAWFSLAVGVVVSVIGGVVARIAPAPIGPFDFWGALAAGSIAGCTLGTVLALGFGRRAAGHRWRCGMFVAALSAIAIASFFKRPGEFSQMRTPALAVSIAALWAVLFGSVRTLLPRAQA